MSPIEYIEDGILQGDWEVVCEGYERLTGKALPLPDTATDTDRTTEALQRIAYIVSSVLSDPLVEVDNTTTKPVKRKPARPKCSNKKKTKKKTTVTKSGEDSSLRLDDSNKTIVQRHVGTTQLITNDPDPEEVENNIEKAKKAKKNKLQLKRTKATTYEVPCNECEKLFQSNRPKGKMGQKCPNCLRGLKSRFS